MLKHIKRRSHNTLKIWPKISVAGLAVSLLAFASFALAQSQELELTAAEKTFIEDHPLIKVGGEIDWGPFDFVNEQGQHAGIASDYLQLVSDHTGLRFEVEPGSFSKLLEKLGAGEIDLIPAIYFSEERSRSYNYTSKYHQVAEYFFARDDAGISTAADLPGKTVAMLRGFASIETLRNTYPDVNIIEYESLDDAIDAVVTHKADLLFDAIATLTFTLREKSISNIRPTFKIENSRPFHLFMASRKDLPELASIISKVILSTTDSEKQTILSRWLGGAKTVSSRQCRYDHVA